MYIHVYFSAALLVPDDHIHDTKNIQLVNVLQYTSLILLFVFQARLE